ncbi:translation initiation factor IF-3 [Mollicutes bacterium LVI A0039]|nr:translation initiation factor IF-3 [Mollicutes bacterium LVI A0039]
MRNNKGRKSQDIMNDKIRSKEVRLIDETGENQGVVATKDALKRAEDNELDLVLISPNSNPPVAKIIDYGKHKFEQQKRKKEQQANQKKTTTKEVRLSPTIDKGDFEFKMKQAHKFLEQGNKVQFALRFRGRMITHNEIGRDVINRAVEAVSDVAEVEQRAKMDGRRMFAVVAPIKK